MASFVSALFQLCLIVLTIGTHLTVGTLWDDGTLTGNLQDDITLLRRQLAGQSEEISHLLSDVRNTRSTTASLRQTQHTRLLNLDRELTLLSGMIRKKLYSRRSPGEAVAFYVQLSTDIAHAGNHQTILYDIVPTNIGDAYNVTTGCFKAPVNGTYMFAWTTTNKDLSYMNTELVVNDKLQGKTMSDAMDHIDYAAASNIAVLSLVTEDVVCTRTGVNHNGFIAGSLYSTFSGLLIA